MFANRRIIVAVLTAPAALLLAANDVPVAAVEPGELDLAALEALDTELLEEQRGGFTIAGMTIALGAEFRTYLDGELVLRTTVNWQPDGATREEWASATISQATAEQMRDGILSGNGITMRVGDQSVYLGNDGRTALIHRTDGGLQNVILNTASNTSIRQEADIALDIAGYDAFGASVDAAMRFSGLATAIEQASIDSLP